MRTWRPDLVHCQRLTTCDYRHEIYKYQERAHRNAKPRAASVSVPAHTIQQDPAFEHIHEPGGFRRNYILLHANQHGLEEPPVTSTFIDFLYLFGHFAGEDLEEDTDDELETIDEEAALHVSPTRIQPSRSQSILRRDTDIMSPANALRSRHVTTAQEPLSTSRLLEEDLSESTPLLQESSLQRRVSRRSLSRTRRSRRSSIGQHGDATVSQAILMVCNSSGSYSFLTTGTAAQGIYWHWNSLPGQGVGMDQCCRRKFTLHRFSNGGMLFSAVTLVFIALISLYSFILLVDTKMVVPGSFGGKSLIYVSHT